MSLSYETLPGDIDHLIADDHANVERQFQHLEAGRGDRRALVVPQGAQTIKVIGNERIVIK